MTLSSPKLIGLYTFYLREINRFLKVYHQTLLAPIVNAVLFYTIFIFAFGNRSGSFEVEYKMIVATGLIAMTLLQNSYSNTSSSICASIFLGFITDYLVLPFQKIEFLIVYVLSGLTRGVFVATGMYLVFSAFIGFHMHNPLYMFGFIILGGVIFSLLGVIFGSLSKNFDQSSAYQSYIIMPLTFLSGTFYSIQNLPPFWQKVIQFNPVFYIIDGLRYSMIGFSECNPTASLGILALFSTALFFLALIVMKKYYALRT